MQDLLSHFETLKDFEPSICSIFQGAKKGAFNPNQGLPIASGDGPSWLKGLQARKTKSMTFNYKSVLSYLVLAL